LILSLDVDLVGIYLGAGSTDDIQLRLAEVLFRDSIDSVHRTCLEMWIWAVSKDTDMLFEFLNFGLIHSYLSFLRLSILNDRLQIFVKDFVLISLSFDITLQTFVILSHLNMKFVLYDLSFFHQNVHHNIDFFSNIVCFLFEQLEHIITGYKFVL